MGKLATILSLLITLFIVHALSTSVRLQNNDKNHNTLLTAQRGLLDLDSLLDLIFQPTPKRYNPPKFDCQIPVKKTSSPKDVRTLHPSDIKVVMAAGDSITAGFAMDFIPRLGLSNLIEIRQRSFAIGAKTEYSLFNYLKRYNNAAVGGSVKPTLPLTAIKNNGTFVFPLNPRRSVLNAARSLAIAGDLKTQIDYLDRRLRKMEMNGKINRTRDWKFLTVLIGANNLCRTCNDPEDSSPENYYKSMKEGLEYARLKLPRTFVNVVELFNLSTVHHTFKSDPTQICQIKRATVFSSECGCLNEAKNLPQIDANVVKYNQRLHNISEYFAGLNDPEFAVVLNPGLRDFVIPADLGLQMLSDFDCFHPSELTNQLMSIALWNNLFKAPSAKISAFDVKKLAFECPTDTSTFQ